MKQMKHHRSIIIGAVAFATLFASDEQTISSEISDLFGSSSEQITLASISPSQSSPNSEVMAKTATRPVDAVVPEHTVEPLPAQSPRTEPASQKESPKSTATTVSSQEESGAVRPSARRLREKSDAEDTPAMISKSKAPTRSNQFTLSVEPKKLSYILPAGLENAQIELMALDGQIITSKHHKAQDVGGAIDTTSLGRGHYILRLVDETGGKAHLTRAVTINK